MLQNQLALTEGLKANQKAITDGFSQFERLADMQEFPGIGSIEDGEDEEEDEEEDKKVQVPEQKKGKIQVTITKEVFDKYLNNKESQDLLKENGFEFLPSYYFDKNIQEIDNLITVIETDLEEISDKIKNKVNFKTDKEGYQLAESKAIKRGPNPETIEQISTFNTLSKYAKNLTDLYKFKKYEKTGSGLFSNPEELLHRFELVNGSLAAGNNGVLPEYIQIAHRLRDLGIITNNQLNTLLRKVI